MNDPEVSMERGATVAAPSQKIRLGASTTTGAGRGVFATTDLEAGELVESCPVIALPNPKDRARLRKTELVNYYFLWGHARDCAAIALGFGSLYNHSYTPNLRFEKYIDENRMHFYAIGAIKAGEELTINYNGTPEDTRTLWIKSIPPANALPGVAKRSITKLWKRSLGA